MTSQTVIVVLVIALFVLLLQLFLLCVITSTVNLQRGGSVHVPTTGQMNQPVAKCYDSTASPAFGAVLVVNASGVSIVNGISIGSIIIIIIISNVLIDHITMNTMTFEHHVCKTDLSMSLSPAFVFSSATLLLPAA